MFYMRETKKRNVLARILMENGRVDKRGLGSGAPKLVFGLSDLTTEKNSAL